MKPRLVAVLVFLVASAAALASATSLFSTERPTRQAHDSAGASAGSLNEAGVHVDAASSPSTLQSLNATPKASPEASPRAGLDKDAADASLKRDGRIARPRLKSASYVVINANTGEVVLEKDAEKPRSIASITKLMSAMVYLDMDPDLDEDITVTAADRRGARPAPSRLYKGWTFTARDLLYAGLMASENPAIEALARSTGLTRPEFVGMMNRKAQSLGMTHTIFFDATGLDAANTASPLDVVTMLEAASRYPLIATITTTKEYRIKEVKTGRWIQLANTDRLLGSERWKVIAGKTGYISEAGYCLALNAHPETEDPFLMVFLGAPGRLTRFGDAVRVLKWVSEDKSEAADRL